MVNGIVKKGDAVVVGEFAVQTATNMYPGRLVKKGSSDSQIVVNDGTSPVGWLAYEHSAAAYQPADRDTIYTTSDVPAVIRGPIVVRAHLASGENVAIGAPLKPTSAGELAAATVGTDEIVAYAMESVNASSAAAAIWVFSVI